MLPLELITGLKSIEDSETSAEWTYKCRKHEDVGVLAQILDPKLYGAADLEQPTVLISVAKRSFG